MPGTPPRLLAGGKPRNTPMSKIAGAAAWADPDTLVMRWQYYETPHHDWVTCRFKDDAVTITFKNSIAAMRPKAIDARGTITGKLAG
jgi:hypothetical protein